ncbi:MAG: DUF2304 domain-containing protein [Chloroflexota bacterium]
MVTIQLVRRRQLREEHALLWFGASGLILAVSLFSMVVGALGAVVEVSNAPTVVLVLGLVFVLAILLSHSVILTSLADHGRDLAQNFSILEWQVHEVDERFSALAKAVTSRPRGRADGIHGGPPRSTGDGSPAGSRRRRRRTRMAATSAPVTASPTVAPPGHLGADEASGGS